MRWGMGGIRERRRERCCCFWRPKKMPKMWERFGGKDEREGRIKAGRKNISTAICLSESRLRKVSQAWLRGSRWGKVNHTYSTLIPRGDFWGWVSGGKSCICQSRDLTREDNYFCVWTTDANCLFMFHWLKVLF